MKAEYLHYDFARATATQLMSTNQDQLITERPAQNRHGAALAQSRFRRTGNAAAASPRLFDSAAQASSIWNASNWEFDVGARAFFSNGLDGELNRSAAHRPMPAIPSSRGCSGATSIRWPVKPMAGSIIRAAFAEGYLGAADCSTAPMRISPRAMPIRTLTPPYGKHGLRHGRRRLYVLETPGAKVGAFVGYNFFSEQLISHGCSQMAGSDILRTA